MTQKLSDAAASVWAKSVRHSHDWLPLWRHLDDSAAVAGQLWDEWLPPATKDLIAGPLPSGRRDGRLLAVWLAGVHDIGKATPTFAAKAQKLCGRMRDHGLAVPHQVASQDTRLALHATTGQVLLEKWLLEAYGWGRVQARPFAVVVGGHHGVPPGDIDLRRASERRSLLGLADGQGAWQRVQQELLDRAATRLGVDLRLPHWRDVKLTQPAQVLLTALVIVADWIASNEDLFPYDPERLHAPTRLADAMGALGLPRPWRAVPVEGAADELLATRFSLPAGSTPYPVQAAALDMASGMPAAGLLVIEAPMGEGKTEAALAAAEQLAARSGAGGCFVALPTRATSDAMFSRVRDWLTKVPNGDPQAGPLTVNLAHGKARFNNDFTALMRHGHVTAVAQDEDGDALPPGRRGVTRELAAHRWLMGRKKAMLSPFVVGTIDQLLFGALKSRHLALRHLGLAGKVVIIDEAHAYDVYMSQYLDRALAWLAAYRVPTIVLSATLPAQRRKQLFQAYDRGLRVVTAASRRRSWRDTATTAAPDPYALLDGDIGYPALTASSSGGRPVVRVVEPSSRASAVTVSPIDDDLDTLTTVLRSSLTDGGCALVIRNTVRRVQEAAAHLRPALAEAGIEVTVAHSRFLAPDRAEKDRWLRDAFGSPDHLSAVGGQRPHRHVLVASQVAEQSLDLDFDLLVTDLAPADLVLQRAGRLHRHQRGTGQRDRPQRLRTPRCLVTGVDWSVEPPGPVRGSIQVYGRYPLLCSLAVLRPYLSGGRALRLPTDIAPLVQAAYSDDMVGPAAWGDALAHARKDHDERRMAKEAKAKAFRLAQVGPPGEPITGWLDGNVGDADDDPRLEGRKQVRDTAAESVDVLVVVRRDDGALVTPPWLPQDGGREVSTEHTPSPYTARVIASCTLSLPYELCRIEVIEELERLNYFAAWQLSPWLQGELVLVLDEHGTAELWGRRLHYDTDVGLTVTQVKPHDGGIAGTE